MGFEKNLSKQQVVAFQIHEFIADYYFCAIAEELY